ncbi:uncharacterized protein SAPINGB_P001534 [Magnusiomyces paraingens]|uniref:6-phosphofructo-2-kinase domain-containing protein n=1 Tax=Magnusiomyces paraingens TaxID=2606893 RepID=A0A5E8B6T3_9ASCO|nr:uncharacterized protein SAPINGB_P001534 [Saprochaete ingens]VVT47083.1 unnamed protein product [Saprochaete ingens]
MPSNQQQSSNISQKQTFLSDQINSSSSSSSSLSSLSSTSSTDSPDLHATAPGQSLSPVFNRWPASDTPEGSHVSSPRDFSLAGQNYYSFGGSGSESLNTTPPGGSVTGTSCLSSVPHLAIGSIYSPTAAAASSSSSSSSSPNSTPSQGPLSSDLHGFPTRSATNLACPPHHRSTLASLSPMTSAVSPAGTPVLSAVSAAPSPSTIPSSETSTSKVPTIEEEVASDFGTVPKSTTTTTTTTTKTTTKVAPVVATSQQAQNNQQQQQQQQFPTSTVPHRRATTLDVPGLTRSRVSPNGYISQRDVGSKLVIVMVGLPARGKSYVTNKLCRYLNWQQHNTRIFNVGNTRRKANKAAGPASVPLPDSGPHTKVWSQPPSNHHLSENEATAANLVLLRGPGGYKNEAAKHEYELKQELYNNGNGNGVVEGSTTIVNSSGDDDTIAGAATTATTATTTAAGAAAVSTGPTDSNHGNQPPANPPTSSPDSSLKSGPDSDTTKKHNTEQTADFFSADNPESFALREKWAMDTLDDLLDYVVEGPGSVGILDATNTTIARRHKVLNRIKERSNGQLKVLYLESICSDYSIIERNIRLKLSGPDYKDCDTEVALKDFVDRMRNYEKVYQPITEDEDNSGDDFQYIKMIDVGKKVVCYNIKGFLAGQVVFFLLNFNLAERQIWITRHGESLDNAAGRIGGDSPLTPRGQKFAKALARFMDYQKSQFRKNQLKQFENTDHFLETTTPPLPRPKVPEEPNFCVWTSMLKRAIDTAGYFDEDVYDVKEMRMLNELGAGICDGMTYPEIKQTYPQEYQARMANKISYRYPGPGGESYLDVINRLRPVIVEVERMTDNALIIAHRVVCRILLAYFMNLSQDSIGDLDVPLHTLYCLEPKPYGVSWEAYEYDDKTDWFYRVPKETMLERNRRPSIAPPLSGRSRQYSVMPTTTVEVVPPVYSAAASHVTPLHHHHQHHQHQQHHNHNHIQNRQISTATTFLAGPGSAPGSVPIAIPVAANRGGAGSNSSSASSSYTGHHNHSASSSTSTIAAPVPTALSSALPTVSELSARLNSLRH